MAEKREPAGRASLNPRSSPLVKSLVLPQDSKETELPIALCGPKSGISARRFSAQRHRQVGKSARRQIHGIYLCIRKRQIDNTSWNASHHRCFDAVKFLSSGNIGLQMVVEMGIHLRFREHPYLLECNRGYMLPVDESCLRMDLHC